MMTPEILYERDGKRLTYSRLDGYFRLEASGHQISMEHIEDVIAWMGRDPDLVCPDCGAALEECAGEHAGRSFAAVRCPNGHSLTAFILGGVYR
jgi:hypothetical protein